MLSKQVYTEKTVVLEELFPNFTHEFLEPFEGILNEEIKHEDDLHLDFSIKGRKNGHKISPILRLAKPEDAEELIEIYKELYDGTYPYKEMEDIHTVHKMIEDPSIQWIIFQDPSFNIAGCITFVLDYVNKRGYIRGFMLREKYQGFIDITKAMIGSMVGMLHKYRDTIYTWYVENRTAHAKSQYSMYVCGITPIGFYPNKDVFCGKVESDLMQILYDERALNSLRSEKIPQIIPAIESCFQFSGSRYGLSSPNIATPDLTIEKKTIKYLKKSITKKVEKDRFGYETITFSFVDSNSFFQFLYTPQVNNFEKTVYKTANLEELYVFIQEFLRCKEELEVRYCEVFISAYKQEHQQLFYDAGFKPRGYVPSWRYSTKNSVFKDSVLFSIFDGTISDDIQLIDKGYELLQTLGIVQFSEAEQFFLPEAQIHHKRKKIVSVLFNPENLVKNSLRIAMSIYLLLFLVSLVVAMNISGFNITKQVISDLGNSLCTPIPFLFDTACGIAGAITLPFSFYIYRVIGKKDNQRDRISSFVGLMCGIFGGLGYMGVGIFSLDRSGPNGIVHNMSAIIAFTGFVFSILFFSIPVFFHTNVLFKLFGTCGIVLPLVMFFLNGIIPTPFLEWMLLFSIFFHIIPLNYWSVSKYV
jgi:hypothetical protein